MSIDIDDDNSTNFDREQVTHGRSSGQAILKRENPWQLEEKYGNQLELEKYGENVFEHFQRWLPPCATGLTDQS